MSNEPEVPVARARRRIRLGFTRRERTVTTVFWLAAGAWIVERLGWIPDLPSGIMLLTMQAWMHRWLVNPFPRRSRPLLLPGMSSTPLAELRNIPPRTHVHVRGRIRALESMKACLGEVDDAVYRRIELTGTPSKDISSRYSEHRAESCDFLLVDETGATVEIRMSQAEVKLPRRMYRSHDRQWIEQFRGYLPDWGDAALHQPTITEHWLADGDEIEVLGTIERVPDPTQEALPRELPTRPVLVSTGDRPLTVQLLRPRER